MFLCQKGLGWGHLCWWGLDWMEIPFWGILALRIPEMRLEKSSKDIESELIPPFPQPG